MAGQHSLLRYMQATTDSILSDQRSATFTHYPAGCRWPPMVHDRQMSDELSLTQQTIARVLRAAAPGSPRLSGILQMRKLLRYRYGRIMSWTGVALDKPASADESIRMFSIICETDTFDSEIRSFFIDVLVQNSLVEARGSPVIDFALLKNNFRQGGLAGGASSGVVGFPRLPGLRLRSFRQQGVGQTPVSVVPPLKEFSSSPFACLITN